MNFKVDINEFNSKEEKWKAIDKINTIPLKICCQNCEHYLEGTCLDCNAVIPEHVKEKGCPKYMEDNCPL